MPTRIVSEERWGVRAELNTPSDAVVIIQVGRWEPLKGHRLHLEALARLLDLPAWECWFVGGAQRASEEHYLEEIKDTCLRLRIDRRVRFLGERSDVQRLLAAADIYCQSNTSPDSFGLTFIEGLLAQLPVVTTALGGALEIVDSSCGVLVPPDDLAALASCLRQLIANPALRSRLGTAGPSRARELCDPNRQMTRIYDFFRRATKQELAA
jgi:glycosyltransferase involved in cell wall biosynthesis